MVYAYTRVSTKEQNLARQVEAIKVYRPDIPNENIRFDKQSGKDFCREGYLELKSVLRPGDELVIKEFDRLGRNKDEMKDELRYMKDLGVTVRILDIPTTLIDFQGQEWLLDMVNNIMVEVLGAVAENERKKIRVRQREGIDCMPVVNGKRTSTKTNRPTGRPSAPVPDSEFQKIFQKQKRGEVTAADAARALNISRSSWYNLCRAAGGVS